MEKARQIFQTMLANHPRDPLVHLYLGNSYFEAGRFEDAFKAFTHGLEIDPGNSLFHYQAAVSRIKLGQDSDGRVRPLLEKAVELDPKLAAAYYQLAKLAADGNNTARARFSNARCGLTLRCPRPHFCWRDSAARPGTPAAPQPR
jgi:cytochrome c-type biogenesis protein CcmH/NrfG